MTTILQGPVEVTPSGRRALTASNTGLDHPDCSRVDEDISSRIRSLLLSRNVHYPPRTPFSSDEHLNLLSEDYNGVGVFDFGTAKSAATLALHEARRMSLPSPEAGVFSQSIIPSMDGGATRRPTEATLRSKSSAHDMRTASKDTITQAAEDSPHPQAGPKKKFKFPRLVLQDKRKRDTSIKSCVEISPKIPEDDAKIHVTDLFCCPPCNPIDTKPSKYIVGFNEWPYRAVHAEPGDLACFLAGCPPGRTNCRRHNPPHGVRRSHSTSLQGRERNLGEDFKAIAQGLAKDVAKLGINMKDIKIPSTLTLGPLVISDKQPSNSSRPERPQNDHNIPNSRKLDGARSGSQQDSRNATLRPVASVKESSPRSSITSIDAFPHVVHSEEVAAKEADPQLFSATVVTNFSLPGPKARRSNAGKPFSRQHSTNQPPLIEDVVREADVEASHTEVLQTASESQLSSAYEVARKQSVFQCRVEGGSNDPQSLDEASSSSARKMRPGRVRTNIFAPKSLDEAEEDVDEIDKQGIMVQTEIDVEEGDASEEEEDKGTMSTEELKASGQQGITVQVDLDIEEDKVEEGVEEDGGQTVSEEAAESTPPDQDPVETKPKAESSELDQEDSTGTAVIPDDAVGDDSSAVPEQENTNSFENQTLVKPSISKGSESTDLSMLEALPSPVVGHLTNLKNAIEFVDNVRGRMQDVEKKYEKKAKLQDRQAIASNDLSKQQNDDTVSPQPKSKSVGQPVTGSPRRPASPETSTHSLTGIDIAINVDKTLAKHPLLAASSRTSPKLGPKAIAGQDVVEAAPARASPSKSGSALLNIARPSVNRPSQLLDVDPLDSAYWGFVPAVKEAVQDAVQVAVRNAVHEIVVPPGVEQDTASDAYRKLVADSLSQAAKNADDYLRRASLWNEPSSSPRLPEAGVQSPRLWQKDRPRDVSQNKSENALLYHQENNNRPRRSNSSTGRYGNSSTAAPSNPQSPSSIGLETVPLDQQPEPDNQKRESRFSASWKKGAPAGYDAIPTRKSSRNHVLGPKSSSTNSSQRVSPKNPRSRGRSYERLASRSQGLRSISSVGSLENPDAYPKAQREDELGRNNTVHWLKELLSNDKPYEPRLTALPPRARRGENRSTGRIRSQTAPMKPVDELFLGATPEPAEDLDIPKSNVDKLAPETFTRTINDLENLLNEALLIARQAADREDAAKVPAILEDATKVLKDQRKVLSEESLLGRATRDQIRSRAFDRRGSDDISSVPSIHESLRSYSGSSASEFSDDDETAHENQLDIENANRGRNVTVSSKETGSNHPSGWPPTGRSSTPYPPESQPASGKSITVDTPLMEENISNDSVGHIRAADPRSMPAETGLSPRKSSAASKPYTPGPLIQRVSTSFTTLEPFGNTTSSGIKRESSAKSPGRVSPVKKSPGTRDSAALQDAPYNGSVPLPRADSSAICKRGHSEDEHDAIKARMSQKSVPSKREVRKHIKTFRNPPIQPRASSLALRKQAENSQGNVRGYQVVPGTTFDWQDIDHDRMEPCSQLESEAPASAHALQEQKPSQGQLTGTSYSRSLDGTLTNSEEIDFSTGFVAREHGAGQSGAGQGQAAIELKDKPDPNLPPTSISRRRKDNHHDLRGKTHVSLREHKGFSLARSHKRQTIARDWSPSRKRFSAAVACISTALVGILVGIYAGEVPAIQYYIVDFHHYTVLGNVFFFIALAVPTFFFWPLPLLHGRKPYILGAMAIAMPLLFPQAIAVGQFRSPYVSTWRVGLILSRALMGFCLGFANMNFKSILTDLFGASLQSANPHQEVVDEFDVRRHGGGMGVWLGLWTWSAMGSIGVGFMAGAVIINSMTPAWGFYISIVIIAAVLLLNIITPEVRRSAYRRSVAEVRNGADVSRRLARGEVKMHMVQTGPKWWGEEFHYGVMLSAKMIRQPGFLVMSVYVAWMYAQIVLIIVLLGSLMSKYYKFKSPQVGLSVTSVPLGAMLAIPFQSASLFSRSRSHGETTDDETFDKKVHWSSHLVRRAIFILVLPFAGLGYTLTSSGPPIPFILPILFAALIGFLSNLAMAECHGIIMETFDTSDLQPGMTGRPRGRSGDKTASKRTNYSSFPRVASAFAITQGIGYLFAAVSTGVGGSAERQFGAQAATGIMAGILLILSILLLLVLARFREVQIIPDSKADEMSRWRNARRASAARREEGAENEEEPWRPVIIGNPTHHTRRMCLLEMGGLTRWSEIRRKNRLVDEQSLEAKHPNLVALEDAREKLREAEQRVIHNVRRSLSRASSRGSRGSRRSDNETRLPEGGDLGGHREMLSPSGNGNRRRKSIIRE